MWRQFRGMPKMSEFFVWIRVDLGELWWEPISGCVKFCRKKLRNCVAEMVARDFGFIHVWTNGPDRLFHEHSWLAGSKWAVGRTKHPMYIKVRWAGGKVLVHLRPRICLHRTLKLWTAAASVGRRGNSPLGETRRKVRLRPKDFDIPSSPSSSGMHFSDAFHNVEFYITSMYENITANRICDIFPQFGLHFDSVKECYIPSWLIVGDISPESSFRQPHGQL